MMIRISKISLNFGLFNHEFLIKNIKYIISIDQRLISTTFNCDCKYKNNKLRYKTNSTNSARSRAGSSSKFNNNKKLDSVSIINSIMSSQNEQNPPKMDEKSFSVANTNITGNNFIDSCGYNDIPSSSTTTSSSSSSATLQFQDNQKTWRSSSPVEHVRRYFEDIETRQEINDDYLQLITRGYGNGIQFTVVSYNILAQDLLELHPYLYRYHKPDALIWENRLENLINEILSFKAEFLCLQEVQEDHFSIIAQKLSSLNYDYIYKKKTGIRSDGCAIFYNKNLFSLISKHSIEFFQPNITLLDRENVAIVAKFCLKTNPNALFVIATTHLLYNPRRQDVRLAQIQVLLAELDRLSIIQNQLQHQRYQYIPIILTGDFNLQPYSAPYDLLTRGYLYYYELTQSTLETPSSSSNYNQTGYLFLPPRLGITDKCQHIDLIENQYQGNSRLYNSENYSSNSNNQQKNAEELDKELYKKYKNLFSSGKLTHKLNLKSVYTHKTKTGEFEGTTHQNRWITVDYIFYNNFSKQNHSNNFDNRELSCQLELLARYRLPSIYECQQIGTIPNSKLGSDHLSLGAKFFLSIP